MLHFGQIGWVLCPTLEGKATKKSENCRLGLSAAIHSKGSSRGISSIPSMNWGGTNQVFIDMFSGREQLKISQAIRYNHSLSGTLLRQSIRLLVTPYINMLGNPLKVHLTRCDETCFNLLIEVPVLSPNATPV
ncbi:hypothetical protein TNCV_2144171 [Trichonephila clavipes]|nr:hypothetical protein TNCV_2144171 [Trichonephila clavipes]